MDSSLFPSLNLPVFAPSLLEVAQIRNGSAIYRVRSARLSPRASNQYKESSEPLSPREIEVEPTAGDNQ